MSDRRARIARLEERAELRRAEGRPARIRAAVAAVLRGDPIANTLDWLAADIGRLQACFPTPSQGSENDR